VGEHHHGQLVQRLRHQWIQAKLQRRPVAINHLVIPHHLRVVTRHHPLHLLRLQLHHHHLVQQQHLHRLQVHHRAKVRVLMRRLPVVRRTANNVYIA